MSKLRAPLKTWLDADLPEAQVQRMWRKLNREPSRRWRWSMLGAGVAFVLSAALWWFVAWSGSPRTPDGPLLLAGRPLLSAAEALGGDAPIELALSDGSHVALAARTQLIVLENNAHAFALQLVRGRTHFEVRPGGPRRWLIECGAATIEVVGTSFSVERDARGVRVEVTHGVVLVRSLRIRVPVRRLVAGESVYVSEESERVDAGPPLEAAESNRPSQGAVVPEARAQEADRKPATVRAARAATSAVVRGEAQSAAAAPSASSPSSASRAVEVSPPATERSAPAPSVPDAVSGSAPTRETTKQAPEPSRASPATLAQWLDAADAARRARDPQRAEVLLARVVSAAPGSAHAALADLTLARLRLERDPAAAAAAVSSALAAALPQGLREDAAALLVESRARAGQRELALVAARAYLERYPEGQRAKLVRRWAGLP